jgi:hypothetical protein
MLLDKAFVIGVVLLSGLTPVLILWTSLPKPLQALPSALAAVAAGVAGSFSWRDNRVRWKATQELLKSELSLFDVSAGTYKEGGAAALNIVALRVEELSGRELEQWRSQQMELAKSLRHQVKHPEPPPAANPSQPGERLIAVTGQSSCLAPRLLSISSPFANKGSRGASQTSVVHRKFVHKNGRCWRGFRRRF